MYPTRPTYCDVDDDVNDDECCEAVGKQLEALVAAAVEAVPDIDVLEKIGDVVSVE